MVFRNDPCPCGSGKRYKKCCLKNAKRAEKADKRLAEAARRVADAGITLVYDDDLDELDELSNSVLDLVKAKRFDEALTVCTTLLERWPDYVDGLDRSAIVHEQMGNRELARSFYERALAFIDDPVRRDDFDEGTRVDWRERIVQLSAPQNVAEG